MKLDDYCRALNTPIGDSAATPYQVLGYLATAQRSRTAGELISVPLEGMAAWSAMEFRTRKALVEELQHALEKGLIDCAPDAQLDPLRRARGAVHPVSFSMREASRFPVKPCRPGIHGAAGGDA